jgi:hypothetical protein
MERVCSAEQVQRRSVVLTATCLDALPDEIVLA